MSAVAFDTLKLAKGLREGGFSESQAESVSNALKESLTGGDIAMKADVLAVSNDLKVLRNELKADMAGFKADMAEFKAEIIKWMFGAMLAQGAAVVALVKLLPGK